MGCYIRIEAGVFMERLKRLVFSFYREDHEIRKLLEPLNPCIFTRSKGSICIDCLNFKHLEEISALLVYLIPPFASLRLCKQIILRVPGVIERGFPLQVNIFSDLSS